MEPKNPKAVPCHGGLGVGTCSGNNQAEQLEAAMNEGERELEGPTPATPEVSVVRPEVTSEKPVPRMPFARVTDIERLPEGERWLVDGFMTRGSLTVLAAAPKAGKTWVGLALAVGVASGTSALGRFHVGGGGRVLIFPAEDDVRSVRERIEALCVGQGVEFADLPIDVIKADTMKLDVEDDRAQLEELLEHLRPAFLVLDPLVRLHSGAESYVGHISELFGYLRKLQRRFEMAILVTHHLAKNKGRPGQVGQAMRGSGDIHAAYDHGASLQAEPDGTVVLQLEHRTAAAPDPVGFRLVSDEGGGTRFEFVELSKDDDGDEKPRSERKERRPKPLAKAKDVLPLKDRVVQLLEAESNPLSQVKIRTALGVRNQALTEVLRELAEAEVVENLGRMKGWRRTAR